MPDCEYETRLNALHDGELDARIEAAVRAHLPGCSTCSQAMEELSRASRLMLEFRGEEPVSAEAISRIHAGIDRRLDKSPLVQPDPAFWRTARLLSGLAASVLIVASAWLWETPRTVAPPVAQVQVAPAWERVAMTLQADPLPYSGQGALPGDQTAVAQADASMADWILTNLDRRSEHEGR